MIFFVTASHKKDILQDNLLQSVLFEEHYILVQEGYSNVCKAYNDATKKFKWHYITYAHHDVYLPFKFEHQLLDGIAAVSLIDPDFGVIGVAGSKLSNGKREFVGNVKDRGTVCNTFKDDNPIEVDTIDELLLITKGDFVFDEKIPGNHFYGADICMEAKKQGRKNYVINAYVEHNSSLPLDGTRPADFEPCRRYFREKWFHALPVPTTCTMVTV